MTEDAPSLEPERDRPGARIRALAGLIIIGASVALAVGQLAVPDLAGFVTQNLLPAPRRKLMLALLGGSVLLTAGPGARAWRGGGPGKGAGGGRRAGRPAPPPGAAP